MQAKYVNLDTEFQEMKKKKKKKKKTSMTIYCLLLSKYVNFLDIEKKIISLKSILFKYFFKNNQSNLFNK